MRAWWAIFIFLASSLGVAAVPRTSNKPVTRDDILYLLNQFEFLRGDFSGDGGHPSRRLIVCGLWLSSRAIRRLP